MSIISEIPNTIMEAGRARAEGVLRAGQATAQGQDRSGQMWAGTIGDLGKIGSQIPGQIAEFKGRQQVAKIMQSALKPNAEGVLTYDRPTLQKGLQPESYLALSKHLDEADAAALKLKEGQASLAKSQSELEEAHRDALGAIGAKIYEDGNTPEAFHAYVSHGIANQAIGSDEAQAALDAVDADPSKVEQIAAGLMAASPKYKNYLSDRENRESQAEGRKASAQDRTERTAALQQKSVDDQTKAADEQATKRLTNAAKQLSSARTQADYARRYAGLPADVQAQFDSPDQFDPKATSQRALFVAMKPEDQLKALHDEVVDANRSAELAIRRDREARLDKEAGSDKGAAKAATIAQKAAAEKWKADKLMDLEQAFKSSQGGTAIDKSGQSIPVMTVAELNATKDQIQKSYLAQIGMEGGAPKAAPQAQGKAPQLDGLTAGKQRRFTAGPFAGQVWTLGTDGQPHQVK